MRCTVEHSTFNEEWEATVYWMKRDGLRASIMAMGSESSEAVSNLYDQFERMKAEGWERTK